jgi:hypothetical protein
VGINFFDRFRHHRSLLDGHRSTGSNGSDEKQEEQGDMDHHTNHRPGTDSDCAHCQQLAYEPGWYAALVAFVEDDLVVLARDGATTRA